MKSQVERLGIADKVVFTGRVPHTEVQRYYDLIDILAYPRDRTAWGRLTKLLTVGKSRGEKAECVLFLDDLLEYIRGLNLIVRMAGLG